MAVQWVGAGPPVYSTTDPAPAALTITEAHLPPGISTGDYLIVTIMSTTGTLFDVWGWPRIQPIRHPGNTPLPVVARNGTSLHIYGARYPVDERYGVTATFPVDVHPLDWPSGLPKPPPIPGMWRLQMFAVRFAADGEMGIPQAGNFTDEAKGRGSGTWWQPYHRFPDGVWSDSIDPSWRIGDTIAFGLLQAPYDMTGSEQIGVAFACRPAGGDLTVRVDNGWTLQHRTDPISGRGGVLLASTMDPFVWNYWDNNYTPPKPLAVIPSSYDFGAWGDGTDPCLGWYCALVGSAPLLPAWRPRVHLGLVVHTGP